MATLPDPNGEREEGSPFQYKPRRKLDPADPKLPERIHMGATRNLNKGELATMLGVSRDHLADIFRDHPHLQEAYEDGRQTRRAKLRMLGDRHAITDPSTWRFLAKNELELSDDPSKAKADEAAAGLIHQQIDRGEIDKRIMELQAKVFGRMKVIEHEEVSNALPVAVRDAQQDQRARAVRVRPADAPRRQDASEAQGAGPEGLAQPQADAGGARLAKVTNTGEEADHAPPKLPGRIERRR
jgi:AraC-like DNA-binding protein